jgi:hypothetical protein
MNKIHPPQPVPIYTTSGATGGFLVYPYLYDAVGEWIGWVDADRRVYSVIGHYVGWLDRDFRILCRRGDDFSQPDQAPPPRPERFYPPATVPLPPMMAELKYETLDVLEEMPDLLPVFDAYNLPEEE